MLGNSELWGGLFWLLFGVVIIWAGRNMGLGVLNNPGPGFAFYWLGILMSVLALCVIGHALTAGAPRLSALWAGTRWGKVATVVALLLIYAFGFERIGFIPCTLALLLIIMWFVDPVDWLLALVVAVVATFGVWAVFTKWLKIQLPVGILEGVLR
jgi:putative tricarboxylic transport membrane protein